MTNNEIIEKVFSSSDWQDEEVTGLKYSAVELKKAIQEALSLQLDTVKKAISDILLGFNLLKDDERHTDGFRNGIGMGILRLKELLSELGLDTEMGK